MSTTHKVKRGETIVQIAQQHGFRTWEPIWNHEENAELRSKRPNAYLLVQDDEIFIPDKELKDHSCKTNMKHIFRVRTMTQMLHQVVLDEDGQPLAGKTYELTADGFYSKKKLDASGAAIEEIPIKVKTATLKVWLEDGVEESMLEWNLQLGHLEPASTVYGLKTHLINLGYDCAPANDDFDEKTKQALIAFQKDYNLTPTGENDAPTKDKLKSLNKYIEH